MEFSKIKITSKKFIGRQNTLEELTKALQSSSNGRGNLILIEGEAGIGKTRLITEFTQRVENSKIQYLRGSCKFHQDLDPYSPFIEALRDWFGITKTVSEKSENDKIGKIIRSISPELISIVPLIRGFVSAGTYLSGNFLFKSNDIEKSFRIFKELTQQDRKGLFISRAHPDEINDKYELQNTKLYWLTKSMTEVASLEPSQIEKIRWLIKDFVSENQNSVILVDGLEYLILQNNFENVLKFVELLKDDIAINNAILILPIDPATLEARQLALLERYMRVITPNIDQNMINKVTQNPSIISAPGYMYMQNEYAQRQFGIDYAAEKDKMFEAILELVRNISLKKTLILLIDDLHWADYSSVQLLQYLFQNTIDNNLLIIGSYRPEDISEENNFIQKLVDNIKKLKFQDRLHILKLKRLQKEEISQVVKNILNKEVPNNILNLILEKSEGNPLYIEEIIKSLLEENFILLEDNNFNPRCDKGTKDFDVSKIEIPDSITELIRMRIDRITKVSELNDQLLKHASIIGSKFNFDILLRAMNIDEELLLDSIENLMRRNIIHEVDVDIYKFDHTYIREVIYNHLGSRRKKILHAKIGQSIESLYINNLEEHYAELAYHFSNGNVIDKAVFYSIKEGEIAKELCAYDEALIHYRSALDMLKKGITNDSKKSDLINIYLNLGDLSLILGYWDKAKSYFEKSLGYSKEFGDDLKKVELRSKLGQIEIKKKRWCLAIKELEKVLNLKLDPKKRNYLLLTVQPQFIIRANITLIKILLKEELKGLYICINHPSKLIDKVLKTHQIPTKDLIYLDFFTSLTGVYSNMNDNIYFIDNAFSLDAILNAMQVGPKGSSNKFNFDLENIDFILVDNISSLITYTTQEKIQQFIEDLIKNIRKLTAVYGIVIVDNKTSPKIQKLIEHYFDKSVTIKEDWL